MHRCFTVSNMLVVYVTKSLYAMHGVHEDALMTSYNSMV
jgi:hypothetical protein